MSDTFTFENLWKNHPKIAGGGKVCDLPQVTNHCALNIGVALTACGIDTYKIERERVAKQRPSANKNP